MAPDPNKLKAVQEWPAPCNVTDVRQFLGLASYYRRYIPHFAHIAGPLHALTQKNTTFDWTDDCQQAFTALKAKLVQPPVLKYPQFHSSTSQFLVYTDASDFGTRQPCDCVCKPYSDQIRTKLQRHPKRMFSYCVCH